MASFRKRGLTWTAEIRRKGVSTSATFSTKAEAVAWAAKEEANIIAGKRGDIPNKTFGDLLSKYADEVSPTKKGERWERLRIGLTLRDEIAKVNLRVIDARDVAAWRDRRLAQVSPASVRREWNLLSNACTIAMKEWKWLTENPMREVRRPPPTEARDRRISQDEIDRLMLVFGDDVGTVTGRVGKAFLFAIETAMRAGEIAGLAWDNVRLAQRYCKTQGKTAAAKRDVPLSNKAIQILKEIGTESGSVFNISTTQIDALFRKVKAKAVVDELHFHDSRHEAITRLAKKLDVLALARTVGHRDLRQLMVYYNESAEDMAGRL
ncbi:MAG: site-specific integrase [Candidatus Nitrotoga sp.]|nr:site-specific integrase [Candidatus Nitrotoga sp.]